MDDSSWDFFCNNSPRLVIKTRPKTPIERLDNYSQLEIPKITLNPKIMSKPSEIAKSAFRSIYRDKSPLLGMMKSNTKLHIKPNADIKGVLKPITLKKSISPMRGSKKPAITSKRVIFGAKDRLSTKQS